MTFSKTDKSRFSHFAGNLEGQWYESGVHLARVFKCTVGWGAVVYPERCAGHFVLGSHATEDEAVTAAEAFMEMQEVPRMNVPADIDAARAARRSEANGKPRAIRAKSQGKRKDVATGSLF